MVSKSKPVISVQSIARAGLIAALYVVLVFVFKEISFFAYQVRIAEALTVLAYLDPMAIIGLYVGAMLANVIGGLGPIDIFFGSFLTLTAAALTYAVGFYIKKSTSANTYRFGGPFLGLLPPVLVNAFGVAYILKIVLNLPYFPSVISVGVGQFIAVYILGYPFLQAIIKRGLFNDKGN